MDNSEQQWLQNLKAGDIVFHTQSYGFPDIKSTILRTTSTMIIISAGKNAAGEIVESRYNRKTGCSVGSDVWHKNYLLQPTPEREERYELDKLIYKAEKIKKSIVIPSTKQELERFIESLLPFVPKQQKA